MRPIPIRLLIHSATLKHPASEDRFQARTYTETQLSRVRFEPVIRTVKTKENTEAAISAVMLYDCVNSRPQEIGFEVGDRIVFDGTDYEVRTIGRLYDNRRLHHFELELM